MNWSTIARDIGAAVEEAQTKKRKRTGQGKKNEKVTKIEILTFARMEIKHVLEVETKKMRTGPQKIETKK